jgi:hypothetical protein
MCGMGVLQLTVVMEVAGAGVVRGGLVGRAGVAGVGREVGAGSSQLSR